MSKNRNLKILILEDEVFIRENLNIFLENEGFSISFADNAKKALEFLNKDASYSIGIIDIVLPEMSGEEFIKQANKINPDMKYIIHTGSKDYVLPEYLKSIGVVEKDVFNKPIMDISLLIKRIKELSGLNT